jgi:hypothetical protein
VLLSEIAYVVEQSAAGLILKPCLCPGLAKRLAWEAGTDYVHLRDIVDDIAYVGEYIEAPWLAPVGLIGLSGMLVDVSGEDAFMAQLVQGSMEASDATEEVGESHQYPKDASG